MSQLRQISAGKINRLKHQTGKMGYILLWLIGIPIPVLFVIYLLRGCS